MQSPNKQPEEEFLQSQPQSSLAESLGKHEAGFCCFALGFPLAVSGGRPSARLALCQAGSLLQLMMCLEQSSERWRGFPRHTPEILTQPSVCSAPNGSACSPCSVRSCLLLA